MKKLIFIFLILFFGVTSVFAEGFKFNSFTGKLDKVNDRASEIKLSDPNGYYGKIASPPTVENAFEEIATGLIPGIFTEKDTLYSVVNRGSVAGGNISASNILIESTASAPVVQATIRIDIGSSPVATLSKDGSNNLVFADPVTGPKTLAQLVSGGTAYTVSDTATLDLTLAGQDIKGDVVVLKDLVTTAPLTGGTNDILVGADADITLALTTGIADTNAVVINAADVADNDYAKFTATGLEGRSYSEVLSDIGAQASDADLTTYAGITPTANAQTLLGETFAQMQASMSIDDLITLSGVAEGSVNLATFTGTTIADNVTIKAALQALETSVEGKQASDADLTTWAGITPAANVGTFLATPSSANLKEAVNDETGSASGAPLLVFNQAPTINNPAFTGDPTITDTSPSLTLCDSSDNVCIQRHLDTADTTYGIWQIWKTDQNGNITVNKPYMYGDASGNVGVPNKFIHSFFKSFTIPDPVATDDCPLGKIPYDITITAIYVQCTGGTNIVGGLDEYDSAGASIVAAVDSDITVPAGTSVKDDGSLTNGGIAAGNYLFWHTTSISGTPTSVTVTVYYTE